MVILRPLAERTLTISSLAPATESTEEGSCVGGGERSPLAEEGSCVMMGVAKLRPIGEKRYLRNHGKLRRHLEGLKGSARKSEREGGQKMF